MHKYYKHRRKRILKLYGYMNRKVEKLLAPYYEDAAINGIMKKCVELSGGIIERLPYIGGAKNPYTPIIIINGWFVCLFKAMQNEGIDTDIIIYFMRKAMDELLNLVPGAVGRFIGRMSFTRVSGRLFNRMAKRSQKKQYPGNFVFTFKVTKWSARKKEREAEMRFEQCGVHKYYEQEDCAELKGYCNFFDPMYGARFGMGIDAGHTFAQGCSECVLSFNNKRETPTPDNIKTMIINAEAKLADLEGK